MSIFKEKASKKLNFSLSEEQKRDLADSKWIYVIAITVASFVIGGGWQLCWPASVTHLFQTATTGPTQVSAWVQFIAFFGLGAGIAGFIISAATIDVVTHNKANR